MRINVPVRFKNPWFWVGLVGVVLSAMGVSAEMFTSWGAVWDAIVNLFSNPFVLGSVVLAVLGVFVDPTTAGIGDSTRALTYKNPSKE
ncbi:MAG: phage holin [Bacteroidales bacterium]|nr:phage holin [Bacteroidales bacterium]